MTKIFLVIAVAAVMVVDVRAHDAAHPELDSWYESLHSAKGPCCSDADRYALSDVEWEAKNLIAAQYSLTELGRTPIEVFSLDSRQRVLIEASLVGPSTSCNVCCHAAVGS